MARKPSEIVAVTLRIREDLRRRLEREAKRGRTSLNGEMEQRLEDSFEMANMASLIRVLVGGGFTADLLAAIAKVFDLGGEWKKYPEMSEAARVRIDAAYIALTIIFTELFSTPEHPVDPAWAAPLIAARRGHGGGEVNAAQMEGSLLAQSVLTKVQQPSLLGPSAPRLDFHEFEEAKREIAGILSLKRRKEKVK
jgi:hypothetical protein